MHFFSVHFSHWVCKVLQQDRNGCEFAYAVAHFKAKRSNFYPETYPYVDLFVEQLEVIFILPLLVVRMPYSEDVTLLHTAADISVGKHVINSCKTTQSVWPY